MENCPRCQSILNLDEKSSGKCFSCGASFESTLPKDTKQYYNTTIKNTYDNTNDNTIAKILKICGIIIIILGTISSFVIAGGNGYKYEFTFTIFLSSEAISVISGLIFIGFSEIIQLLENIKNKLK